MAFGRKGEFHRIYIFFVSGTWGLGVMVLVLPIFMDGVLPMQCIMLSFE
jgi:hypothetical protein